MLLASDAYTADRNRTILPLSKAQIMNVCAIPSLQNYSFVSSKNRYEYRHHMEHETTTPGFSSYGSVLRHHHRMKTEHYLAIASITPSIYTYGPSLYEDPDSTSVNSELRDGESATHPESTTERFQPTSYLIHQRAPSAFSK